MVRPGIDILLLRDYVRGTRHESSVDLVSCVEVVIVVVVGEVAEHVSGEMCRDLRGGMSGGMV